MAWLDNNCTGRCTGQGIRKDSMSFDFVGLEHKKSLRIETRPADELKWQILDSSATVRLDVVRRTVKSLLQVAANLCKMLGLV